MPRASPAAPVLLLALVAALAAHQLLVPPIVGVADNGDYTRVMTPLGLAHVGTSYEDTVFLWVQQKYRAVPADAAQLLPTSEHLLAGVARGIHALVLPGRLFDLRLLGAVHLAFCLVGVWLIFAAAQTFRPVARIAVWAGVALATPDVGYIAYLNSFYSEPASLIFLLIWLGLAFKYVRAERPGPALAVAYFAFVVLFTVTKVQNYALAVPAVAMPLTLLLSSTRRATWRAVTPLAIAVLALVVFLFARLPEGMRHPARWNAVFHGLLVGSPSQAEDLAALGLEADLARWTGVRGLEIDGTWHPAPVMEIGGRLRFRDIAWFYVRNPDRLVAVAAMCARSTFVWQQEGWPTLGNYTRDSGRPPAAHAPSYTGWSTMQGRLMPKRLWFLVAFFTVFVGVAARELRAGLDTPGGRTALLCLTLAALAILAFAIVVMASGVEDPVSDLFMFRVLFDVCLVAALARGATLFAHLVPSRTTGSARAQATPRRVRAGQRPVVSSRIKRKFTSVDGA